jgi:hypothetical protein
MGYQQTIIVKTQLEALHKWGNIPEDHPSYYLKNLHRHIFHIEMRFKVTHADRDLEFIALKELVEQFICNTFPLCPRSNLFILENGSCEMLGMQLLKEFQGYACYWVQVLEDGEMGAITEIE